LKKLLEAYNDNNIELLEVEFMDDKKEKNIYFKQPLDNTLYL